MRKRLLILPCIVFATGIISFNSMADDSKSNETISGNPIIKALHSKRDRLIKEIKSEDSKRNRQIAGVSPESMEIINDSQDSLCLALRSELTDVILEIKELSPGVDATALMQQYQNLIKADSIK